MITPYLISLLLTSFIIDSTSEEIISPQSTLNQHAQQLNKEQLDEETVDPLKITSGIVTYGIEKETLSYYHCGPLPDNPTLTELVLLHGAAFSKEDWKTSGILNMLCEINNEEDEGNLSITALDLPVKADGIQLSNAFDALSSNNLLSGRAVTIVSPSASGKAIVSLGDMPELLPKILKAWIPVASGAVMGASESTLQSYKVAKIPILAIHGNQDSGGKKVTDKLKSVVNAKGIELSGRHPVYLDSPEEFVQEVMEFLDEEGL